MEVVWLRCEGFSQDILSRYPQETPRVQVMRIAQYSEILKQFSLLPEAGDQRRALPHPTKGSPGLLAEASLGTDRTPPLVWPVRCADRHSQILRLTAIPKASQLGQQGRTRL
jgi:hypothetical protein